ncbi:MAG: hypothetical protein PUJ24_09360 [Bacteroidales bacterium]|nr:hypothetical protein [Bacteroidales bacterium]
MTFGPSGDRPSQHHPHRPSQPRRPSQISRLLTRRLVRRDHHAPELRKAHAANDLAVMRAYCFSPDMTEGDIVASLLKMYERLTASPYVASKAGAMGRGNTSDN